MRHSTLIKKFCYSVTGLKFKAHKYKEWATNCYDEIRYTNNFDEGDAAFRCNMIARCPAAACYSDFLLSLLHELGHIMTSEQMTNDSTSQVYETYEEYFATHDETIATDWAIDFIMNKNNFKLLDWFEDTYKKIEREKIIGH